MKSTQIVTSISQLRNVVSQWRRAGDRIGLVPTMGALHEGHLSLVRQTQKHCSRAIVSIFVNPAQFAPHEDFDRYPRALQSDTEKLSELGLDLIFAPTVSEIYPTGFATSIEVGGPSAGLESEFRPHFFAGVATVVAKLFIVVAPDYAIFGEKDYQQLLVVRRLTSDLGLPIEIAGGAIVREPDGLAMSSRNAYLNPDERRIAAKLNVILKDAARSVRSSATTTVESETEAALLTAGFNSVDYVAVRDAATLENIERLERPARILAAVRVGGTRLIDNMAI
jgi:pantoate--beta-alanine ligase